MVRFIICPKRLRVACTRRSALFTTDSNFLHPAHGFRPVTWPMKSPITSPARRRGRATVPPAVDIETCTFTGSIGAPPGLNDSGVKAYDGNSPYPYRNSRTLIRGGPSYASQLIMHTPVDGLLYRPIAQQPPPMTPQSRQCLQRIM